MDIKSLLKGTDNCRCGMEHKCPIHDIFIGKDVISSVKNIAEKYSSPIVVCDDITYEIAGKEVCEKLSCICVVLSGYPILIPDENAVGTVIDNVKKSGSDHIIGVGSGVINDIVKYASFLLKMRYTIVATAPSMDGYASSAAAMLYGGLKTTFSAHCPEYIIADTEIIRNAPADMLRSGIGDILGKISCLNDWRLSSLLTGEPLCEKIYAMVQEAVDICASNIPGIMNRDATACEELMKSLILVGICMSYMGNSRPASGAEHHMSHFFEVTGILNKSDYFSHGMDVGYSAAIVCRLREMLIDEDFSLFTNSYDRNENGKNLRSVFGVLADDIIKMRDEKNLYDSILDSIKEKEREIKDILSLSMKYSDYIDLIGKASFDMKEFRAMYSEKTIRDCILYAKDLKDRYTLLRILCDCGLLEQYADKIVNNI